MSSTWNGSALQTRFAGKHGFTDTTSLARILEYINDIQDDITAGKKLPFLKFKMKKHVVAGTQEVDLSPQIPSAATLALLAGGALTTDSAVYAKVTFVIFDEAGREFSSIESEPSVASNTVTPTGGNLSLTLTNIDTYDGSTSVNPLTIHRRIYLKQGTGNYVLAKTLEDNTTTTTTITANTSSLIEPPEFPMVDMMSGEDPFIQASGTVLYENKLDDINKFDPNVSTTGTPNYYSRIARNKIKIYPAPSADITLSYWVYRVPARVFADTDRVIQIEHNLKKALDAGVTWKGFEYSDSDGQETKLSNYEQIKSDAIAVYRNTGGQAMTVKEVC